MKKYYFVFLFTFLFLSPLLVSADLAPIPEIEFNIGNIPEGERIIGAKLISCDEDKQCGENSKTREEDILWGSSTQCTLEQTKIFCIDTFSYYQQLSIDFSGKTRKSSPFRSGSDEVFNVLVKGDSLEVTKSSVLFSSQSPSSQSPSSSGELFVTLVIALIITILLEVLVAVLYQLMKKYFSYSQNPPQHLIKWVILANIISLPIFWLSESFIDIDSNIYIIIGEIAVFLFEALFIVMMLKRKDLLKEILLLSLIMNLVTYLLGGFFWEFLISL